DGFSGQLAHTHGGRHLMIARGDNQPGRIDLWNLDDNQYVGYQDRAHGERIESLDFSR
ncbi:MAG: hypothetical protein GWO24_12075, partial [Akkermansiaceae bacterium]|nr:hypothetical protein [Akkermansiaceae bacterium]